MRLIEILVFLFLSIGIFHFSFSQIVLKDGTLINKDGTLINYNKLKLKTYHLEVKTSTKEELKIESSKVLGYFSSEEQRMYYNKPVFDNFYEQRMYEFLQRRIEGTINVYERIVQTAGTPMPGGGMIPGGETIVSFIEKGYKYKRINIGTLFQKDENLEILKEFMQDNKQFVEKLNDRKFKLNYDNFLNIVREYNLASFQKNCEAGKELKSVIFYSKLFSDSSNVTLSLNVNDSIQYDFQKNRLASINLSSDCLSKVCFQTETQTACDLISSSTYFTRYFEVVLDRKSLKFEKRSSKEYQRFINEANTIKIY